MTEDLVEVFRTDTELTRRLRTFDGVVRLTFGASVLALRVADGVIAGPAPADEPAAVEVTIPPEIWAGMTIDHPPVGVECLTSAQALGATIGGDWPTRVAPYLGAWNRFVRLAVDAATGRGETPVQHDPFAATDDPIGRYVRYPVDGLEHRVYYETAGTGPVPVLLLHTAGADSRQYRHVLADPVLQAHYTMTALDLPYHGKSLPPLGSRWWERTLVFDRQVLLDWVAGFIAATGLDRPVFVGCSVGGQLASDLCAERPEAIRGAIGINGLHHMDLFAGFDNDRFRDPRVAADAVGSIMYDVTGRDAPEDFRRELEWIYTSNHRDAYPADNHYFMFDHDLRANGHLIDTARTPLIMLTGEYDLSMLVPDHGGGAVAEHVPGAQWRVMPGLSHFAPSDDPLGFREHLTAALADIVALSSAVAQPS